MHRCVNVAYAGFVMAPLPLPPLPISTAADWSLAMKPNTSHRTRTPKTATAPVPKKAAAPTTITATAPGAEARADMTKRKGSPASRRPAGRSEAPTVPAEAQRAGDRASHRDDAARDDRLARSLVANAGISAIARHRARVTGIENEEDGVPDDEDTLEDAAEAEIAADTDGSPGPRALT